MSYNQANEQFIDRSSLSVENFFKYIYKYRDLMNGPEPTNPGNYVMLENTGAYLWKQREKYLPLENKIRVVWDQILERHIRIRREYSRLAQDSIFENEGGFESLLQAGVKILLESRKNSRRNLAI